MRFILENVTKIDSNKNDSTVFYVGKTEVLKNPSDSEYRQLYNEQRKLHPNTNEPLIRQTFGEFGNYYIWPAYDSTHYSIELYIYKKFGERTNQNKDYDIFNHYYLDEDLEHPFPNSKIKQVVYHTSNKDFDKFDSRKKGSNTGWIDTNLGYFFSDNKEITKQFGTITKAYYINLKKPLDLRIWRRISAESFEELNESEKQVVIDLIKSQGVEPNDEYIQSIIDSASDFDAQSEIREQLSDKESVRNLRKLGYDGIIDIMDRSIGANEYIVFNANQIKVIEKLDEGFNKSDLYGVFNNTNSIYISNEVILWSNYITPEGLFIGMNETGEHEDFINLLQQKYKLNYSECENIIFNELNFIKCNISDPYIILPKNRLTHEQQRALTAWLERVPKRSIFNAYDNGIYVATCDYRVENKYSFNYMNAFDIIKEIAKFYSIKSMSESFDANSIKITDNPYNVKNILNNTKGFYRIIYDARLDKYIIGSSLNYIHRDLILNAYKFGEYYEQEEFINYLGAIDNYIDAGKDGFYSDSEEIDPFLYYIVFIPKNEVDDSDIETEINDGYDTIYEYKFGYLLTRDCDLKDTELYKILGSPISVKNI